MPASRKVKAMAPLLELDADTAAVKVVPLEERAQDGRYLSTRA